MTSVMMWKRLCVLIGAAIWLAGAASAFQAKQVVSPGGVTAWLVEDRSLPLIALSFTLEGGAATDPVGKEGSAAFMASLLTEGAGEYDGPAFQARSDELAVRIGFSSSADNLSGWLNTLSDNRTEAARLMKLALAQPRFSPESIERVRQQLDVAARGAAKDPGTMAFARAAALTMPGHAYSRFSRGSQQSIATITRDDIVAAHRTLVRRTGLIVSAAGDISEKDLGALLDEIFASLPDTPPPPAPPDVDLKGGNILEVIPFEGPQTFVLFGQQGVRTVDPAYFTTTVLMELLGGGTSRSWLNREVREKRGLTYGIDYGNNPLPHAAFLAGSFQVRNEQSGAAVEVVRATIRRLAEEGPTETELGDIKTYMTGSYALRFDSTGSIADYLTALQMARRPIDFAEKRNGLIEAVTLKEIRAQAKRLLQPDNMLVIAVGQPVGLN
jgi:zinc protease